MTTADVLDHPERNRYELRRGERVAGFIDYKLEDRDVIALLHAEVEPELRNQGLGEQLVRETFDDLRARGLSARAVCPFVRAYVRRHPEVADLVV